MDHARNMASLALIKRASPTGATLAGAAIGAGVGGLGLGLADYARNKKKDQAINSGLLGALLGGVAGGGIGRLASVGPQTALNNVLEPDKAKTTLTDAAGKPVETSLEHLKTLQNPTDAALHAGLGSALWGGSGVGAGLGGLYLLLRGRLRNPPLPAAASPVLFGGMSLPTGGAPPRARTSGWKGMLAGAGLLSYPVWQALTASHSDK